MKLRTDCTFFGKPVTVACDGNCGKAWGIVVRPCVQLSADEDDDAMLADDELGDAPSDPGTYEGSDGKPLSLDFAHNKWCLRQCERSVIVDRGDPFVLPDFSRRLNKIATPTPSPEPENDD